eukprot:scaffold65803_cov69-Phaeocystis_antarctica.AAC.1
MGSGQYDGLGHTPNHTSTTPTHTPSTNTNTHSINKHSINPHQHDRYLVTIIKGVVARTSKREHHRGRAGPLSPGALGRPFASPARNYSYTDPPSA